MTRPVGEGEARPKGIAAAPDVVASRWTPVVVGGRDAGPSSYGASARHDAALPVVPERFGPASRGGPGAQHRARVAVAFSGALHLIGALVAIAYVEPDVQLAGQGTLAQAVESGIIVVPVESVAAAPSIAGADAEAERAETATDASAPPPPPPGGQAPEGSAATPSEPEPAAEPPPAGPRSAEPADPAAAAAPEPVVEAQAPDVLAAPRAENSVPPSAPETVEQPTDDQFRAAPAEPATRERELRSSPPAVREDAPVAAPLPVPVPVVEPARPLPPRVEPPPKPVRRPLAPKPAAPDPAPAAAARPADRRPARSVENPSPAATTSAVADGQASASRGAAGSAALPKAARGLRPGTEGSGGPGETIAGTALLPAYAARVQAHYARHKAYPSEARARNLRGMLRLSFTLSAAGIVTAVRVLSSSGAPLLDQAAVDAARRASPFPPIPPELGRSSMPFAIPVRFSID